MTPSTGSAETNSPYLLIDILQFQFEEFTPDNVLLGSGPYPRIVQARTLGIQILQKEICSGEPLPDRAQRVVHRIPVVWQVKRFV